MGHWEFNHFDPSNVRLEVTQRDQFDNDDVELADALVREAIQNSSDARAASGPVKVRFGLETLRGERARKMAELLRPLQRHLRACDIDDHALSTTECRVLTIEDFGTKGLTGRFDARDGENFEHFWRTFGDSGKSGQSGGRWGLGKLVYSSSSMLKSFFGITVRAGDSGPAVMGQAVLSNHRINKEYYVAHGFWFDQRSLTGEKLQLPVTDSETLALFREIGNCTRTTQTGLSIVIPYLIDSIDRKSLISGVVANYYFPILAGQLEVEVDDVTINRGTFRRVVADHAIATTRHIPFDFIASVSDAISQAPAFIATAGIGPADLDDKSFTVSDIEAMKQVFAAGELLRVRVPVSLRTKVRESRAGHVDLFLRSLREDEASFSLFARGPIILPGERNFSGASALGALVANDPNVAAFLGDAENPAHTGWNSRAKKLTDRWSSPQPALKSIRSALRHLYTLVAEQPEVEDLEALADFFSIVDQVQSSSGRKKRSSKPKVDVAPRERAILIQPRKGGFDLVAGPAAEAWTYPRELRVRLAYDMIGANPFTRHSKFDFDLEAGGEIQLDTTAASIQVLKPNVLKLIVESPAFMLEAEGLDERRDLVVDARTLR